MAMGDMEAGSESFRQRRLRSGNPNESPYLHHLPRRPLRETPSRPSGARKFCLKFLNITIPSISSLLSIPRSLLAVTFPLYSLLQKEPVFLIAFLPALLTSHARHVAPHVRTHERTHACGTCVWSHRRRRRHSRLRRCCRRRP